MSTRSPRLHALSLGLVLALYGVSERAGAGAPTHSYDRAAIERSGAFTLAEFLRSLSHDYFGTRRPGAQSASLSLLAYDLHGLGTRRTLVLVDGRPLSMAAAGGREQNLASIPLALVERVEIRNDGAEAGMDPAAALGSVNIVLRSLPEGAQVQLGVARPESAGADRQAASALVGGGDDHTTWSFGAAHERLGAVDAGRPWIAAGRSILSNNLQFESAPGTLRSLRHPVHGAAVPGGCTGSQFSLGGTGAGTRCEYDFNAVADSEPALRSDALALRAHHMLDSDWAIHLDARAAQVTGELTQAPDTADAAPIPVGSPNHPAVRLPSSGYDASVPLFLRHRSVAVGPRNTLDEERQVELAVGVSGEALGAEWLLEARHDQSRGETILRNRLAFDAFQRALADGRYDIYDPAANSTAVLDEVAPDSSRDTRWRTSELRADVRFRLVDLPGGTAQWRALAELREESWEDSGTDPRLSLDGRQLDVRDVGRTRAALGTEVELPFAQTWLATAGVRYDNYDTSGGEPSARIAMQWAPDSTWRVHASHSRGFVAPHLALVEFDPVTEQTNLSIASWCLLGADFGDLYPCPSQTKLTLGSVPGAIVANPALNPERTIQSQIGFSWQPDPRFGLSVDLWDSEVRDRLAFLLPDTVVACAFGARSDCPSGISRFSNATPASARVGLGARPIDGDLELPWVHYGWSNLGKVRASGIDLNLSWQHDTRLGTIRSELWAGWLARYEVDGIDALDQTGYYAEAPGVRPSRQARLDTRWERGNWSLAWQVIHTGGARSSTDAFGTTEDAARVPSWTTHDVQARWRASWNGDIVVGVRNLLDRDPPLDPLMESGDAYTFALHDSSGRTPYLRYQQRW